MVRIQYFRKVFLNCVFFFLHIACLKMRPQWPVIYPGPKRFSENLWHPEYLSLDTCSESVQTYARANYFACSIRKMRQIGEILRKRIFIVKEEKKHDLGSSLPHDTAIPIIARHALLASVVSICSVLSRIEAWLVAAVTRVWWWLFYQTQQIK